MNKCKIEECNEAAKVRGYCNYHYDKGRREGTIKKKEFNLVGKNFGKLTVICKTGKKNSYGAVLWECKCDCGKLHVVTTGNLNSGSVISCGCARRERGDFVDLTGQRFGRLLVIREADQDKHNRRVLWLCLCDCGVEKKIMTGALKSGHTKSCGCLHREIAAKQGVTTALDLSGKRFGKLVAIEPLEKRNKQGLIMWRCLCDCGKETLVSSHHLNTGATKSCGCLNYDKEVVKKRGESISKAFRKKYPKGYARRTQLLFSYQDGARKRKIEWDLLDDDFTKLTQDICFYCASPPTQISRSKSEHGAYIYNGIDRIDNSKGYTLDNVVSCCKICNQAKHAMTQDDFYAWVSRIANHQRLNFINSDNDQYPNQ